MPVPPSTSGPSPASLQVTLAMLALRAQQPEKAQAYFRAALRECWWCWEAFEGLCNLGAASSSLLRWTVVLSRGTGAPPDPDICFAPSAHPSAAMPLRLQPNGLDAKPASTGGFFTPSDAGPSRPVGLQPRFLGGGGHSNLSLDDSYSGSEQSYYALNHNNRIRAPVPNPVSRAFPSLAHAMAGPSSGLFTPDAPDPLASSVPAKRSRPKSAQSTESSMIVDSARSNGRLRAPTALPKKSGSSSNLAKTPSQDSSNVRRSSRLSKEKDRLPQSSSDIGLGSSPAKATRARVASANSRPTKKSKGANAPPSTASRGSSVDVKEEGGSSGGGWSAGEEWLRSVMRCFGRAVACMSRYDCTGVIEAIRLLPPEQRQSWRVLMLRGKAEFEGLEYRAVR